MSSVCACKRAGRIVAAAWAHFRIFPVSILRGGGAHAEDVGGRFARMLMHSIPKHMRPRAWAATQTGRLQAASRQIRTASAQPPGSNRQAGDSNRLLESRAARGCEPPWNSRGGFEPPAGGLEPPRGQPGDLNRGNRCVHGTLQATGATPHDHKVKGLVLCPLS